MDWFQGIIDPIENPDNDEDRKLKIFYYGKIQKDKTPIIFFNWGPGQIWQELIKELAR